MKSFSFLFIREGGRLFRADRSLTKMPPSLDCLSVTTILIIITLG